MNIHRGNLFLRKSVILTSRKRKFYLAMNQIIPHQISLQGKEIFILYGKNSY